MSKTKARFCFWIRCIPLIGRTETKNQKRDTMHALHVSFSLPSLINSTSPRLLSQEVQRFEAPATSFKFLFLTVFASNRSLKCLLLCPPISDPEKRRTSHIWHLRIANRICYRPLTMIGASEWYQYHSGLPCAVSRERHEVPSHLISFFVWSLSITTAQHPTAMMKCSDFTFFKSSGTFLEILLMREDRYSTVR